MNLEIVETIGLSFKSLLFLARNWLVGKKTKKIAMATKKNNLSSNKQEEKGAKTNPFRRILTTNEIKQRIRDNFWLINSAKPFTEQLTEIIDNENFSFFLTDSEGCILHIATSEKLQKQLNEHYIIPGTFPVANSAIEQATVDVLFGGSHGSETKGKFLLPNSTNDWLCYAHPIEASPQTLTGCLAISLPKQAHSSHIKALLKLACTSIEQELLLSDEKRVVKELKDDQLTIFNRHAQADLVVSSKGKVDLISDKACELLGIKRIDIERKEVTKFIPTWNSLPFPNGKLKELENIEVEVANIPNSGLYLLNAKTVKLPSGKVDEIICTLRSMKQVLNESNKYIGNLAYISFTDMIGVSPIFKRLVKDAKNIAQCNTTLLIIGEKYTGKETIAQCIHNHSPRQNYGFVRVDLTKLSEEEMEETLWGYTPSHKPYLKRPHKPGALEFADGGTIYINEVGLLPTHLQEKLLETIKSNRISRLGSKTSTPVDVRYIVSSSVDLTEKIEKGLFRIDLFYALSSSSLRMPSLRDRRPDITLLLDHFIEIKSKELKQKAPAIPKKILLILRRYEWPNNFKEMKELVEKIILEQGKMFKNFKNERDFKKRNLYLENLKEVGSIVPLEEHEKEMVLRAYQALNGSISSISRKLGVSRNTLYLKLKKYGIDDRSRS